MEGRREEGKNKGTKGKKKEEREFGTLAQIPSAKSLYVGSFFKNFRNVWF